MVNMHLEPIRNVKLITYSPQTIRLETNDRDEIGETAKMSWRKEGPRVKVV